MGCRSGEIELGFSTVSQVSMLQQSSLVDLTPSHVNIVNAYITEFVLCTTKLYKVRLVDNFVIKFEG